MKTTFNFIIAAMTAIAVFSSCQKELAGETATNTTDGLRVITVQFDNSTKASLGSDGFTPKFANGDKIRVSNNTESKECEVSVSGDAATFATDLTGNLTAIYPATAAVFTGTGPITDPFFKVEASQDGDIAKAIIAKAEIADASSCATATFRCQTALFQITPPSGVTTFKIKSLNTIDASTGQRSTAANAVAINTEGADEAAKRKITVTVPSDGTAYVALKYGVKLSDLSFEYITDATNGLGAMKGIPTNDIKALASSSGKTIDQVNATVANTKYTIGNTNWHPYVEIQMNSKTYKWATMNIGATETNLYGTYFSWGEVAGHTPSAYTSGSTFTSDFALFDFSDTQRYTGNVTPASCFADCNTPYFDGNDYSSSKYKDNSSATLELSDDAANANWGGSWRMPTQAEFAELISIEGSVWDDTGTVKGYRFGTSPNQIFLPAAGYGDSYGLLEFVGDLGYYWSSSLYYTDAPNVAYFLGFINDDPPQVGTGFSDRSYGQSVRALSE